MTTPGSRENSQVPDGAVSSLPAPDMTALRDGTASASAGQSDPPAQDDDTDATRPLPLPPDQP
jgi:hypothetical protein